MRRDKFSATLLGGDFTPFGYLRNPAHRATSWTDTSGGSLRTALDRLGVEWLYPVASNPLTRIGLALEASVENRDCLTRPEFDALGLTSRHHSCLVFGCEWIFDGLRVEVQFFLAEPDALCMRVNCGNEALAARRLRLRLVGFAGSAETVGGPEAAQVTDSPCPHAMLGGGVIDLQLGAGEAYRALAVLARAPRLEDALERASQAVASAESVHQQLLAEDARFDARCPTLSGDWPSHWREGLHHDFQTTRALVQPPGGVFKDVWPTWMAAWPRVVLAEGTLDMLRLAYADPELAARAVLSLFRDSPLPNLPCIFQGGEHSMLAADGSPCGTAPSWCLPFLSLELLYLRTLDREWLGQLYPFAAAYLRFWLEQRVDREGWLVYKCTWESGEDANPRLDPTASGDADISGRVRPVELQAAMAHAAGVMACFAAELGLTHDTQSWNTLNAAFQRRTRLLYDAREGRYRDWLIAEQRFSGPLPQRLYWGIDAGRFSAQSLTPLLIGERLPESEVMRHFSPPWTLWPSWTLSLVECAAAAGLYTRVGQLAFETIDRVYRVTTRRELGSLGRPVPGSAPEFWPEDWRSYTGNDAYGWGATTANLLIRHLFGFKESRQTSGWVAELTPAFPSPMLEAGRRYGLRNLNYRGLTFDLAYVADGAGLVVELEPHGPARECRVERLDVPGAAVYPEADRPPLARSRHAFRVDQLGRYLVSLR